MRVLIALIGTLISPAVMSGAPDNGGQPKVEVSSRGVTWTLVESKDGSFPIDAMTLEFGRYCYPNLKYGSKYSYEVKCALPTLRVNEGSKYVTKGNSSSPQNLRTVIDFSVGGKEIVKAGEGNLFRYGEGENLGKFVLDAANDENEVAVYVSWVDGKIDDYLTAYRKHYNEILKREGIKNALLLDSATALRLSQKAEKEFPSKAEYWDKATRNIQSVKLTILPADVEKHLELSYSTAKDATKRENISNSFAMLALITGVIAAAIFAYRKSKAAYHKSKEIYARKKDVSDKKRVARLVEDEALKVQVRKEMQSAPTTTESILKEQISEALNRGDSKLATELLELFKLSQENNK